MRQISIIILRRTVNRKGVIAGMIYPFCKNFMYLLIIVFIFINTVLHAQKTDIKTDWANLKKYAADNERLKSMSSTEKRIVFMGNSITESWKTVDSSFFTGKPVSVNSSES